MSKGASIKINYKEDILLLKVYGSWKATTVTQADKTLRELNLSSIKSCQIDMEGIENIDTAGAWFIKKFITHLKTKGISVSQISQNETLKNLWDQLEQVHVTLPAPTPKFSLVLDWVKSLGKIVVKGLLEAHQMIAFLGLVIITLGQNLKYLKRIRFTSFVVFLERSGVKALPIIGIISFLLGIVLIQQGSFQLKRFGAEIYSIDLLAIAMLREVGILITAIIVAGRSGSSFTAQIGTMKLNQEIDAMQTLGLNPIEVLVLPRLLSLMVVLPLLTFYSDMMGLLGGAFMATLTLGMPFDQFMSQLGSAFSPSSFWVGIIKAPVFAFIISLIGCFEGMQVSGGAESIGLRTTKSVVEGIFLVIIVNAAFSILFTYLGV